MVRLARTEFFSDKRIVFTKIARKKRHGEARIFPDGKRETIQKSNVGKCFDESCVSPVALSFLVSEE